MTSTQELSEAGESSARMIRLIGLAHDDFVGISASGSMTGESRILPGGTWSADSVTLPHVLIPAVIAVAENYSSMRFLEMVEAKLDLDFSLHRGLWDRRKRDEVTATLPKLKDYWAEWFQIDFSTASGHWSALLAFIDVRNAIVHGTGRLTPRQQDNDKARDRIAVLHGSGVQLAPDGQLTLHEGALSACVDAAVSHVEWLDERVREIS